MGMLQPAAQRMQQTNANPALSASPSLETSVLPTHARVWMETLHQELHATRMVHRSVQAVPLGFI
jgi:hypothetical protein